MTIILLDIDSTLNNFQENFKNIFENKYPELIKTLPINYCHFDALHLYKKEVLEIFQEDGFTEKMIPLDGAPEAVFELDKLGYIIFFCTQLVTDHSNTMRDRVKWIGKWFGEKWMEKVIFTRDKSMVRGDFLIDDSPKKAHGLFKPLWKLIVFDTKYNKNDNFYGRIYSWKNLNQLIDLLKN